MPKKTFGRLGPVHYESGGGFALCGEDHPPLLTSYVKHVECPKCLRKLGPDAPATRAANRNEYERENYGGYTIKDDMIGTWKKLPKVEAKQLREYIDAILTEKAAKRSSKRKQSPASLMKQITDALATLGYKVGSREKNSGSLKAWLDPVGGRPKSARYDDDFNDLSSPTPEPVNRRSPGRIAMRYKKALVAAGLPVTVSGDQYETVLRGKDFDVILSPADGGDVGAPVFVQVFAGKYAADEREGIDTTDYRYGEGLVREYVEKPEAELKRLIAAMDPDDVAEDDYIDSDSGEIYLEKGRKARTSALHPEHSRDRQEKRSARDAEWAKEDAAWEDERSQAARDAEDAWMSALEEYAQNWTGFQAEVGDEYNLDYAQSAAMDAAEGFFYQYPEWKRWAAELDMKKTDMQSAVADWVYEAIIDGKA